MSTTGSNGRSPLPSRGDIWIFEPNPVRGREQANVRPGVIVSVDEFNHGERGLTFIVPITTTRHSPELFPLHVPAPPELTGLPQVSYVMCDQLRVITVERLYGRRPRGRLHPSVMREVETRIRRLLDL